MNKKGLTLIETLVALGMLSLVIVVAMRLFTSGIKAQVRSSEMNLVNSEASFILERISRELRMARSTQMDIEEDDTKINFTNHENLATIYCKTDSTGSGCDSGGNTISVSYDGGTSFVPITSPAINVRKLLFYKNGDIGVPPPSEQPIISIILELESAKDPGATAKIQTSVVPRVYY